MVGVFERVIESVHVYCVHCERILIAKNCSHHISICQGLLGVCGR